MTTGERIRELRKNRGLGQKELAELCGVSPETISYCERGYQSPKYSTIQKIADALNTSPEFLLGPQTGEGTFQQEAEGTFQRRDPEQGIIQRWQPHEGHRFTKPYTRRARRADNDNRPRSE